MANRFVLNERSYHGKGAIQEIAGEVKSRGLNKALVCSDPDLLKFGVTKKVTDVLDEAGIAYDIYSEIKPNPTIQNVQDLSLIHISSSALWGPSGSSTGSLAFWGIWLRWCPLSSSPITVSSTDG